MLHQYSYDDTNRIVSTRLDRDASGDGILKTESVFDTLGRAIEQRSYVNASNYFSVLKRYDGLDRLWQVSNPGDNTCWTTTAYDALSRVKTATTCDGATVRNDYAGNATTVWDQNVPVRPTHLSESELGIHTS